MNKECYPMKGDDPMKDVELKGIIPPIVTPMNDDEGTVGFW